MKKFLPILTFVFVLGFSGFAAAEDGFGNPFANQAPSALADDAAAPSIAEMETILSIEPAAGDEAPAPAQAQETPETPAESQEIPHENNDLNQIQEEIKGALTPSVTP